MKTIRASEIAAFLYCRRAWWYRQQGYEPANQTELVSGRQLHEKHGQVVLTSGCLRVLAYGLLLAALVLAAIHLVSQLV